jgi:hypothetical protein
MSFRIRSFYRPAVPWGTELTDDHAYQTQPPTREEQQVFPPVAQWYQVLIVSKTNQHGLCQIAQ